MSQQLLPWGTLRHLASLNEARANPKPL